MTLSASTVFSADYTFTMVGSRQARLEVSIDGPKKCAGAEVKVYTETGDFVTDMELEEECDATIIHPSADSAFLTIGQAYKMQVKAKGWDRMEQEFVYSTAASVNFDLKRVNKNARIVSGVVIGFLALVAIVCVASLIVGKMIAKKRNASKPVA